MLDVFYNLLIYPFEFLIECIYVIFYRNGTAVKIILIGILVNIIAIPLYSIADKWQKRESDLQKKFKPKLDEIKAVFKGDKRQMIIQTFYRINHYHPIYALRGLLGLFIQVPIFIAAYNFISGLDAINTAQFGPINDLASPDKMLTMFGITINLLPIIMTVLNIAASIIHARDLTNKERIPLFVMAGLFLVLLYNAPSALLLYWCTTNLFSLIKNVILLFAPHIKKIYVNIKYIPHIFVSLIALTAILFNLRIIKPQGDTTLVVNAVLCITILTLFLKLTPWDKIINIDSKKLLQLFLSSSLLITILAGFFIPIMLISSSPSDFQNHYTLILKTLSRYVGILFIYPLVFYFIFGSSFKKIISLLFSFCALYALVNTFLFSGNYGILTGELIFENPSLLSFNINEAILSYLSAFLILTVLICIFKIKKTVFLNYLMLISSLSLIAASAINMNTIYKYQKIISNLKTETKQIQTENNEKEKIIKLSKNKENVVIFFFDRAISIYIPDIIEKNPDLKQELDGFTFYPQTIGFSQVTLGSISAIFGGYEYTPFEINQKTNTSVMAQFQEACAILPNIFSQKGAIATVIYPVYTHWVWNNDVSIFKDYKNTFVYNKPFQITDKDVAETLDYKLENNKIDIPFLRFSIFRISPNFLRKKIYAEGKWISPYDRVSLSQGAREYIYLKNLTNIIEIISNTNTYTFFGNDITHEPHYFGSNYAPTVNIEKASLEDIEKFGDNLAAKHFYINTIMIKETAEFVKYLKDNDLYDNTKIIIVSDHGIWLNNKHMIFTIYNNTALEETRYIQGLNPLLMVKDFNSHGEMQTDSNFMTIADVPIIATRHLGKIKNPFTGKELEADKTNGVYTSLMNWKTEHHVNSFSFDKLFHVKENIFYTNNWQEIKIKK